MPIPSLTYLLVWPNQNVFQQRIIILSILVKYKEHIKQNVVAVLKWKSAKRLGSDLCPFLNLVEILWPYT